MNEKFNTTIIMVTHDPVAASFSNRVVMLKTVRFLPKFIKVTMINIHFIKKSSEPKVYLVESTMSFNEIIFKNFKQNIAHYAIYLLSLIISVILYFSFVTLKYAHHLHGNQSYPILKEGSQVGSYFLFIIIVVFTLC